MKKVLERSVLKEKSSASLVAASPLGISTPASCSDLEGSLGSGLPRRVSLANGIHLPSLQFAPISTEVRFRRRGLSTVAQANPPVSVLV